MADRYLAEPDMHNIKTEYHDVIIIGSGIAGVYTALETPPEYDIAILTKETVDISNSVLAQGGIAVSLDKNDSPELHFNDTISAGAGMCDEEAVWVLVKEAAENIGTLCGYGVDFDRTALPGRELALSREAAHSMNRIIHAGDTTGKEVCDKLTAVVATRRNIKIKEKTFAIDLLTDEEPGVCGGACDGGHARKVCRGVLVYDEGASEYKVYLSKAVVCATGGYGRLYSYTTNPAVATGDGTCLAYRAGAELMDLEFIQFHPTVLYHPENKSFLISEAVRGEGAILRNINGERFMPEYHRLGELAPRDIVSRSIFEEMKKTGSDHVLLDITFKGKEYLENRFPNIFRTCLGYGIDISRDPVPVAPAEHYCMGGIVTDICGRTGIEGFYACGEAACNGIHGANRLASNSLLEGLVFGRIIARDIANTVKPGDDENIAAYCRKGANKGYEKGCVHDEKYDVNNNVINIEGIAEDIRRLMTEHVGIIRDNEGLETALSRLNKYKDIVAPLKCTTVEQFELKNMVLLSSLIVESALAREESRGAHYRTDFNRTDDINWKKHIIKRICIDGKEAQNGGYRRSSAQ